MSRPSWISTNVVLGGICKILINSNILIIIAINNINNNEDL